MLHAWLEYINCNCNPINTRVPKSVSGEVRNISLKRLTRATPTILSQCYSAYAVSFLETFHRSLHSASPCNLPFLLSYQLLLRPGASTALRLLSLIAPLRHQFLSQPKASCRPPSALGSPATSSSGPATRLPRVPTCGPPTPTR